MPRENPNPAKKQKGLKNQAFYLFDGGEDVYQTNR
jgi:hypothetical protein